MSNNDRDNYWDDDDEDDTAQYNFDGADTDLVKKLRKALKAEQKKAKELESTLGELSKAQRERVLKDVLTSRGVNTKVAKFVPQDIDASEEAISSWLDQNADVFGFEISQKQSLDQSDIASLRQIDIVTQGALSPDRAQDIESRIANAQSEDEILALITGSQAQS